MTQPKYPLRIEGHPARILFDVNSQRQYHWELRGSTRIARGQASGPDEAIDQMKEAVRPNVQ